ncbi:MULTISPECIES: P-loop NTPase fold protein [unclassified Psychrobacter]|uniref:P-loop NTPase fold protein n=1 Tax=unclassified Psychrobacter TaxID=196806 RepID=UPI0018F4D841|nr:MULTISPECIES: P-loop NTPase fold protein [unclassified Psychrobacter]
MANVENLEKRLIDLIDEESSFAIALTGEWGIGKTQFWKSFYEENHKNLGVNKYSYVSLFGIDSIEALKFEIALSTHETTQKKDYLSGLKGIFKKSLEAIDLPKLEGTGVTLSLSKGMISSAMSSLIGDTLICIDDIERLSENLDIKDVMGLVNHLSLEKNCKVLVILHDVKANEQFQEYKEKVFDEVLILDESLTAIEKLVNDNDLFATYNKFYQVMGIKNIRFYQRVIETFYTLTKNLPDTLSLVSKRQILDSILIIRLAYDMPNLIYGGLTFDQFVEHCSQDALALSDDYFVGNTNKAKASNEEKQLKKDIRLKIDDFFKPLTERFLIRDWGEVIVSLVKDLSINDDQTKSLVDSDIMTEAKILNDHQHDQLLTEYHSLNPSKDFIERWYKVAKERIGRENLNNLSFYYKVLQDYGKEEWAASFDKKVKEHIVSKINQHNGITDLDSWYLFGRSNHERYYDFVKNTIAAHELNSIGKNSIKDIFQRYYQHKGHNDNDEMFLSKLDQEILSEIIWSDTGFDSRERKRFILSILLHPNLSNKAEVRQWILNILNDQIKYNSHSKVPIQDWLNYTNNLTENLDK